MRSLGLLLLVALMLLATASYAKDAGGEQNAMLRGGVFMPFGSDVKDELGSTWLDLSLEYKVSSGRSVDHYVGIGWIQPQGKTLRSAADIAEIAPSLAGTATSVETDMWMIPLTYTQRTRPSLENKLYVGGGAGAYYSRGKANFTPGGEFSKSDINFGLFVLGGVAFTESFRLELKYTQFISDVTLADINADTWQRSMKGLSLSIVGTY